jgi:putative ABC transport system permease protein
MLNDLKFAVRQLRKSPGFAAAVIVTLALGIGVNAAVFSTLDGFMLRRLPYPQPRRIATLMTHVEERGGKGNFLTKEDDSHGTSDWRLITEDVPSVTAAAWEGDAGVGQSGRDWLIGIIRRWRRDGVWNWSVVPAVACVAERTLWREHL